MTLVDLDREYIRAKYEDWCTSMGIDPEGFEESLAFLREEEEKEQK